MDEKLISEGVLEVEHELAFVEEEEKANGEE